ncbi:amino acid ABC transporter ATP-binding protein [Nocardioides marmoriginsengisoli]|uniref:Amino acid ABC transporter ATP-binding protein n=1 Tax=Nocardioides marmoriginsengisoli TaxID=661483 RepID=A0A3N0CGS8_9ACTN|nr:amino acid ABC transporter ATP-binding protein [Nocardioides marmoriginsengisoli]RNL62519.1 amino acid ABC transporter ATP-binding protein [Nocardioides marmoriginsengisoli]
MTELSGKAGSGIAMAGVTKQYGDHRVLDAIDLDVRGGERVALIGPSGSGKTTVLRCIARLEAIESGSIRIEGHEIARMADARSGKASAEVAAAMRGVGMVFQQYNLFPNMTVLDNLTIAPVKVLGVDKAEARERAAGLLDLVGLGAKADAYPARLSGGQQQRVAIARSLAMQPSVLLFDEVTSALDPELVGEVLEVIRGVAAQSDVTMLIVTHEMQFARDIGDRVVFMEGGSVVEQGPPEKVLADPENERTQRFLRRLLNH